MTALLLTLRFALELALMAALAVGGWHLGDASWSRWLLAFTLPLTGAIIWGLLLSPKARIEAPLMVRVVLELALFVLAAALLWAADRHAFAALLLVGEVVVLTALIATGSRPGEHYSFGPPEP